MAKKILILTTADDAHALAVAEALRIKGADPTLWFTSDYPDRSYESVLCADGVESIEIIGPEMRIVDPEPHVVWNRRKGLTMPFERLHPSDNDYARNQCTEFRRGLLSTVATTALWINPHEAARRADSKLVQHRAAVAAGLTMPPTLYTNDPKRIRAFLREHGGAVVYKNVGFSPGWKSGDEYLTVATTPVSEDDLPEDDILSAVPGIYQVSVPKKHELRVTVIGRRVFTARLLSQETARGKGDWRLAHAEVEFVADELPPELEARTLDLLQRLGLVFGCLDFIVTPTGDLVFLEVNQMGQFLFVEHRAGIPVLDAFTEFLAQGTVDFAWDPHRVSVRFSDVQAHVEERLRSYGPHAPPRDKASQESA